MDALDSLLQAARIRGKLPRPDVRRHLRESAGLTQQDLASAVGVNRSTIARYEHGTRQPCRARPYSQSKLAREIRDGHLPVVRFGRRTLVDERDLIAYIEARKQRGPDHSPLPLHEEAPVRAEASVEEIADDACDSSSD